ncbi:V-set domain-containing T-cell activation inhibitor 1-like [Hemibagrus wyckioides]|uniref:V-set domain-containing T-cell activation inhibitor 1-like n=1 Tax=Hemibagrus wyckioides TaxID=337641 RepID=UPI00266C0796|nr:V-set domain-containing T-cell activation inhibitor 1-like [Hemibagrus wyckioides]
MHLSVFMVFFFVVGHEGLHVHGPSGPVVAQLGGSVLLPCFIESPLPLEGLQVEWRKKDSDALVSLFQQGKSRPDLQSQVFKGRVAFFQDELLKGNFSILLKNVLEEDAGGYRCKVNTSHDVMMEVRNISKAFSGDRGRASHLCHCW